MLGSSHTPFLILSWPRMLGHIMILVMPKVWRRRPGRIPLHVIILEPSTDLLMPLDHLRVWFCGERFPRNALGKIAPIGVSDIPDLDRTSQIFRVLIRI